jgi:hypothetical protein
MKKLMLTLAILVSLVTGLASADPASRIAAFQKATGGTNLLAIPFGGTPGATTNVLKELAAAGFTDDAVIAASTLTPTHGASITWALKADKADVMTLEFCDKFLAHCENTPVAGVILADQLKGFVPFDQRPKFKSLYEKGIVRLLSYNSPLVYSQPIRVKLLTEKAIEFQSVDSLFGNVGNINTLKSATIEELIVLRLAPELRTSDEAPLILEKATAGAKKKLRAEGRSFVSYTTIVGGVTNVVNPLTAKLAPVVEALNAPLMAGLEDALDACGIRVAGLHGHRAAMQALSDGWTIAILDGEVAPAHQAPYLAALKVSLGIVEYNSMIAQYNGEK